VFDRRVTEFIRVKDPGFREIKERESRDLSSFMSRYVALIIIAQFKVSLITKFLPVSQVLEEAAGM
jgi:hypothetical protein